MAHEGTLVVTSYVESESGPRGIGLDASEQFLFFPDGDSRYISIHRIHRARGTLAHVARSASADGQRRAAGERGSLPMCACSTSAATRHTDYPEK